MKKVYLDNAATTQLNQKVVDEMTSVLVNSYGNPSSTHFFGRDSKTIIELSRKFIANIFKAKPKEIFFTSGGTESNNMIIKSCVERGVERIITTKIEHKAVLNPVLNLRNDKKIELEFLNSRIILLISILVSIPSEKVMFRRSFSIIADLIMTSDSIVLGSKSLCCVF